MKEVYVPILRDYLTNSMPSSIQNKKAFPAMRKAINGIHNEELF
jgi:hypothetical protein